MATIADVAPVYGAEDAFESTDYEEENAFRNNVQGGGGDVILRGKRGVLARANSKYISNPLGGKSTFEPTLGRRDTYAQANKSSYAPTGGAAEDLSQLKFTMKQTLTALSVMSKLEAARDELRTKSMKEAVKKAHAEADAKRSEEIKKVIAIEQNEGWALKIAEEKLYDNQLEYERARAARQAAERHTQRERHEQEAVELEARHEEARAGLRADRAASPLPSWHRIHQDASRQLEDEVLRDTRALTAAQRVERQELQDQHDQENLIEWDDILAVAQEEQERQERQKAEQAKRAAVLARNRRASQWAQIGKDDKEEQDRYLHKQRKEVLKECPTVQKVIQYNKQAKALEKRKSMIHRVHTRHEDKAAVDSAWGNYEQGNYSKRKVPWYTRMKDWVWSAAVSMAYSNDDKSAEAQHAKRMYGKKKKPPTQDSE